MPTDPPGPGPLVGAHTVAFPGGYTRSTGPVIGRFLTELRDGRLVGVRAASGRVLFPPTEYDPRDGSPVTGDFPEVGPAGTVQARCWVADPRPAHPFDRPFAWATVLLDGADTALLHALDMGEGAGTDPPRSLRAGLRVRPRLRPEAERTGAITDIACLRPEVTGVRDTGRLDYTVRADAALTRYLEAQTEGRILGSRARSGAVYVPPRDVDPADGTPVTGDVELPPTGTLTTFSVNHVPDPRAPQVPFVTGYVRLDGADVDLLALVSGVDPGRVRPGMRVRAEWLPPGERSRARPSIRWFVPEEGAEEQAGEAEGR
ncbi:Zn-ribbon domain-containing OB-fold protein [Nocardiopsis suaedae]|uniref:OB-fold domain-containing protein n=1 Tax=Nocardiopsis suaedae TaxID=3018444 RepID=A0ABT4TSI1_9ACTN|nr:OB-fold domain-containing protein [Nocardiopsis suaedae]MDA2807645.1 OB-fold domain-containing protein [Nocardiopsis suaedae]